MQARGTAIGSEARSRVTDPELMRQLEQEERKEAERAAARQAREADVALQQMRSRGSRKGMGCPFYDDRLCVPPVGGRSAATGCSLQQGSYMSCFVYPIHESKKQRGY